MQSDSGGDADVGGKKKRLRWQREAIDRRGKQNFALHYTTLYTSVRYRWYLTPYFRVCIVQPFSLCDLFQRSSVGYKKKASKASISRSWVPVMSKWSSIDFGLRVVGKLKLASSSKGTTGTTGTTGPFLLHLTRTRTR